MIRNKILNFSKNLRDASSYRLGLRNSTLQSSTRRDVESLFLSRGLDFSNLTFYSLNSRKIISANDISYNYKNFTFYLYYNYKNLKTIDRTIASLIKRNESYFKVLNRDLKQLEDQIEESSIKLNSKYNKVKVVSFFKEKDFKETYDCIDLKTERTLLKKDRLVFKQDCLQLQEYSNEEVEILSAEVIWEESFFGDKDKPIKISKDSSHLFREDKIFHWIIGKIEFPENGQVFPDRSVGLSVVLNFNGPTEVNQLFVHFASELPIGLKEQAIEYWNGSSWVKYSSISIVDASNRMQLFLNETISTKKIKIKLIQSKYFDTASFSKNSIEEIETTKLINNSFLNYKELLEEESVGKIHDMSIMDMVPYFKKYKRFGYYREAEPLAINKPLSFSMDVEYLHKDDDCFLEKAAHIVLFGEEDFSAIKKKTSQYERTPRYNKVISLPNSPIRETEVLSFNNKNAKCLFFPNIRKGTKVLNERIKVFKNGTLISIDTDYKVSLDGLGSYLTSSDEFNIMEQKNPEKTAGLFYITLIAEPKHTDDYRVEYDLDKSFFAEESKTLKIEEGSVVFNSSLQTSVGFIRSRISLRSTSKNNESSLIKKYKVLVEEIEGTESAYIEYEDFLEYSARSTGDVV